MAEAVGGSVEGFAVLMNNKAEELGLKDTHFVTPHGLDSDGHQTTAYELAKLANYALNNKKFREIVGTKNCTVTLSGRSLNISNGNELLGNFEGVYGVKTGFTNGANRCLVTACKRGDKDLISVVLGADTKNIRTKDSMNILKYAFKNYEYVNLENKVKQSFESWNDDNFLEIIKGNKICANLELDEIEYSQILVNKNNIDNVSVDIECEKLMEAPVYENTKVGTITIKLGEDVVSKSNILVKETVNKKTILEYFYEIMQNFKKYMLESFI